MPYYIFIHIFHHSFLHSFLHSFIHSCNLCLCRPSHGANFSCNFNGTANVPVDFDDSQTNMNLPAEATPDDHHHSHDFDRHSSSMSGDGFTSSGSSSCPFLRRQSKPPAHLHTPPSSSSGLAQNVDGKAMEAGVLDGEVQVKGAKKQRSGDFNHCYVLNGATNYQLAWSLRRSSEAGKEQGERCAGRRSNFKNESFPNPTQ